MPNPFVCGLCVAVSQPQMVMGLLTDPPGWETLQLTGAPIVTKRVCPVCAGRIRRDFRVAVSCG